jgi:hypothetical protein
MVSTDRLLNTADCQTFVKNFPLNGVTGEILPAEEQDKEFRRNDPGAGLP